MKLTQRIFSLGVVVAILFSGCHGPMVKRVDPATLTGKVMVGYQGWFNAEGDGAGREIGRAHV